MSKKTVPDRDAPMTDAEGRITPAWLEYLKDLDARALREKVAVTSPTNGQVMKYVSSTGLWTPGTDNT
jgi:hypothetical protein